MPCIARLGSPELFSRCKFYTPVSQPSGAKICHVLLGRAIHGFVDIAPKPPTDSAGELTLSGMPKALPIRP